MTDRLPKGWTTARVEDIATLVQYGSSSKASDDATGVPVLRMGNIVGGELVFDGLKYLPTSHHEFPELHLQPGDVLFNRTNSPELVGKTAVYTEHHPAPCSFASYLIRVKLSGYEPKLLASYLNSTYGRAWIRSCVVQQVGQANVSGGKLKDLELPLPPLNEQRRIVAKLDALQERSRRARASLDAVPALLDKLRQSILAAAFRGDLTRDFREQHKDLEPASKLLQRIRAERRKKWEEAELAKLKAKGKAPTDDKWKAKYKEPDPVDPTGLPTLPDGWCWASLETISDAVRGIPYGIVLTGDHVNDGIPTVRCGDIKGFTINVANLKRVKKSIAEEFERTRLEGNEVLLAIRGTVGATAVVLPEMAGMNISREIAMIPVLSGMVARYLMFCLVGPEAESRLMKHVKGVAQAGINLTDLRNLPVPLPSFDEQIAILNAIENKLTACSSMNAWQIEIQSSLDTLARAILAKAFRGELVPQDPHDEPADELLARVRADRAAPSTPRGRKRAAEAALHD